MTYLNTVNYDPAGDPATLQAGASRTQNIAVDLKGAANILGGVTQNTAQAWEGTAAQVFLLITDVWTKVMNGLSEITDLASTAQARYASTLAQAQQQSLSARQRLYEVLAVATPVAPADPGLVASLNRQIEEAHALAAQAGKEFANACRDLIGPGQVSSLPNQPTDANASFVSMAHTATANGVSMAPSAAFDIQMQQLRAQSVNIFSAMSQRPLPVNPAPVTGPLPVNPAPQGIETSPGSGVYMSPKPIGSGGSDRAWIESKYRQHIGGDPSGLSDSQIHAALNKSPSMIKETNNLMTSNMITSNMISMHNSNVAETIRSAENTAWDNMYNPNHPNYGSFELPWFPGGGPMTIP